MKSIPVRDLRNDYAGVLRQVQAGESFTVTKDGRPIASLGPYVAPDQVGPRTWVPNGQVVGSLAHLGPGRADELRDDLQAQLGDDLQDGPENR